MFQLAWKSMKIQQYPNAVLSGPSCCPYKVIPRNTFQERLGFKLADCPETKRDSNIITVAEQEGLKSVGRQDSLLRADGVLQSRSSDLGEILLSDKGLVMFPHVKFSAIEPFSHGSEIAAPPHIYSQGHIRNLPHLGVQFPDIAMRDEFSRYFWPYPRNLPFIQSPSPRPLKHRRCNKGLEHQPTSEIDTLHQIRAPLPFLANRRCPTLGLSPFCERIRWVKVE
jgi:hypothetical protein